MADKLLVALTGQPNAGKSTVFNMLTGARQHVANYPGVTVDKKVGYYTHDEQGYELVDLPGAYSLTSYSLEERVARDFLLGERPAVTVNVADASNLKRHLFLTFQLIEIGAPVVVALNMMDVAASRSQEIDADALATALGVPVVPTVGRKGTGKQALREAVAEAVRAMPAGDPLRVDYGDLEPAITGLADSLYGKVNGHYPTRWLAIKTLEDDAGVKDLLREIHPDAEALLSQATALRAAFEADHEARAEQYIEQRRYAAATAIVEACVKAPLEGERTFSDKVDALVCHRFWGYPLLAGVLYLMYYASIVWGYELTNYTWPWLAAFREFVASILPAEGFVQDPMLRQLMLWLVDSVNALLNYVPIFLILFAYISFLEDLGYMPRMAFLLDAFFRRYGLHGQSTLPMVLGGVYVGGCAVPGVMACRAVPDERSRLATILIVPMMNCLAKVPLYVLLVGIYFAAYKAEAMFFIATITVLMALATAKFLNLTLLREKESAPFIMEMPPYHRPTVGNVVRNAVERVWSYVRKITTVVAAVSVILFVLMQFPGLSTDQLNGYTNRANTALENFYKATAKSAYAEAVNTEDKVLALFGYIESYKQARMGVTDPDRAEAIDASYQDRDPVFFSILKDRGDNDAKKINRAYKALRRERMTIRKEMKDAVIDASFLGRAGRFLEPVSQYAGFNWKVNISLLAALAAKENTVATLGALYQPEEDTGEILDEAEAKEGAEAPAQAPQQGGTKALEARMAEQSGFTSLHALALMLFMALYPPCMAATMVVKVQSGSWKIMAFSLVYMMGLGATVATLIFSGGSALGLTGIEAMGAFYALALVVVVVMGLIKPQATDH